LTDYKKDIQDIVDKLNEDALQILAKRISINFVVGWRSTGNKAPLSALQKGAITKVSEVQFGYLKSFNQAIGDQVETKIKENLASGGGYKSVKEEIQKMFSGQETVSMDNTGKTRIEYDVARDGTITKREVTITQPYSTTVENYADTASRSIVHSAISKGRSASYQAQGQESWRWLSANDSRVRPAHMFLAGNVYTYGTPESDDALYMMENDFNCRCREIPFMNNPKYDTPMEEFEARKEKDGLYFDEDKEAWAFRDTGIASTVLMSYNENHDELGRFASGEGGGSAGFTSSDVKKYSSSKDFIKGNVKQLKEHGIRDNESATEVYRNLKLEGNTPREIARDDAIDIINNTIPEGVASGWLRNEDKSMKPKLFDAIINHEDTRNAGLNIMHDTHAKMTGSKQPFIDFVNTEIPLYRGGVADTGDVFTSYSMDKNIAKKFGTNIHTIKIKPKDTLGTYQTIAEAEVLIPKSILKSKL
jgi:SPP1 gp7 family putative phage head morphogenesis protein